jgi:predicted GTPase
MGSSSPVRRVAILGAAGRDFHNFNVVYRDDPRCEVVAFTAAQIPDIAGRRYPATLAGARYPEGIPIVQEAELEGVCRSLGVDQVVFAYSDVPHAHVMHLASRALAAGADFVLLGPDRTMLAARVPVIAVSAVRTGCGKSQTARWISRRLHDRGLRVAVIRHPMPYGDLERQAVQRFAAPGDLVAGRCTLEEREEYEPHIAAGNVVYAGVDYARVVAAAQDEADVIVWDGGNNDFPFVRPGLHVVLVDPLRPGHETDHHPGEAVLRMADVVVIAKTDAAAAADVQRVSETARRINPRAPIVRAASPIRLDPPDSVRGKRVLVVEDGPSTTHGGMAYGAGYVAAVRDGAAAIVHPREFAAPELARLYDEYPHLGPVLPAMGYSPAQLDALARCIDATPADAVVSGTPIDLAALVQLNKPVVRARYEFAEAESPGLGGEIDQYLARAGLMPGL